MSTNNSGLIQTGKNPDLVTCQILVDGKEIPGSYGLLGISVQREINRISSARIVFFDGSSAQQKFEISDSKYFTPGNPVEITAGYHSDNKTIFKGIVIRHTVKARSSGSSLVLECKDTAVKMTVGRKSRYFYNMSDSDMMDELIGKYDGIGKEIEETKYVHNELVQFNASDWDFLVSRAQAVGKVCYTENGKIVIAKPNPAQDPFETVAYGMSIREFEGEIDARTQFEKVSAYSWDSAEQKIVKIESDTKPLKLNGNLTRNDLAAVIGLENLELKHGGNLPEELSQSWSNAKMFFQEMAKVRGRVQFNGIPDIKPGMVLKLEGIGEKFNGNIFVSGIRHNISNGDWTVDAQFGINPAWFSETYDISQQPAAGLVPAVNGLQFGTVSQLEGDPEGEYRILVKLPIVNSQDQGTWCRIATLDAGAERGSFFLPEIGDEVVVGFVNDDPNNAVILGALNSSAKPAPIVAEDDNDIKGIVTRSGMKLLFDDKKKVVTLETPGGRKVTIDDDSGEVKLEDKFSNVVTMSKEGISVESGKDLNLKAVGDVSIEATNVSVTAKAELKAEGNASAGLSSSGTTTLKGSLVQIN